MKNIIQKIVISLPPRTKKNSQRIAKRGTHYIVLPSKAYADYEKQAVMFMPKMPTIDYAVNIRAIFYMDTRRRVDLVNLEEALCDLLVHYGILEDDNSKIVYSMDGSRVDYDKNNPRTEVYIERVNYE